MGLPLWSDFVWYWAHTEEGKPHQICKSVQIVLALNWMGQKILLCLETLTSSSLPDIILVTYRLHVTYLVFGKTEKNKKIIFEEDCLTDMLKMFRGQPQPTRPAVQWKGPSAGK